MKEDIQIILVRAREYDPIDFSIEKLYGTWKVDMRFSPQKNNQLTFGENETLSIKSGDMIMPGKYMVKGSLITIVINDEENNVNNAVWEVIKFSKKDMVCSVKGIKTEYGSDRIRLVRQ